MVKAIIYTSYTGFTKEYADILSKELNVPAISLDKATSLEKSDEIVYLGWISAGSIKGYKKANKNFNIKAIGGVGLASPSEKLTTQIAKANNITNDNLFVLKGGYAPEKITGFYKIIMKLITKMQENKKDKTPDELENLNALKNGANFISVENLGEMLEFLKK